MKKAFIPGMFAALLLLAACDNKGIFHEYVDYDDRYWLVNQPAEFKFAIDDTTASYNLFCNIRNSTRYPYSRIFINFSLSDTTGKQMQAKLLNDFLFEPKTGKPFGKSGLGDLYDHQIPIVKNQTFPKRGEYKVRFEQFMRTDTLNGILSVGLSIEKAER
jgi:gliding motility-associated lipoprotein GldH